MKLQFRKMIGEEPGDVIASDELIQPKKRTDAQKTVAKGERYRTHRASVVSLEDREHVVLIKSKSVLPSFFSLGGETLMDNGITDLRRISLAAPSGGVVPRRTKQASSPY
jgi:hypothetical protein